VYGAPLMNAFWDVVNASGASPAEAHAFVAAHGGAAVTFAANIAVAVRVLTALIAVATPAAAAAAFPKAGARDGGAAVRDEIALARAGLFAKRCVYTHWKFWADNDVSPASLDGVTYAEWEAFAKNPFVLMEHGVKFEVLLKRPCADATATRYASVVCVLRASQTASAPAEVVEAELDQHPLPASSSSSASSSAGWSDILCFDPSCGGRARNPVYAGLGGHETSGEDFLRGRAGSGAGCEDDGGGGPGDGDDPDPEDIARRTETFIEADARLKSQGEAGGVGYGTFHEFKRLSNRLVYHRRTRTFWLVERYGVDESVAEWAAHMVWDGADEPERAAMRALSRDLRF